MNITSHIDLFRLLETQEHGILERLSNLLAEFHELSSEAVRAESRVIVKCMKQHFMRQDRLFFSLRENPELEDVISRYDRRRRNIRDRMRVIDAHCGRFDATMLAPVKIDLKAALESLSGEIRALGDLEDSRLYASARRYITPAALENASADISLMLAG